MKDPIERQAAIDEIQRFLGYIDQDMIDRIKIGLRKLPTIEAEPVKRGEWTEKSVHEVDEISSDGWQSARCSVCGRYHTTPYLYFFTEDPYCPSCGARMVQEEGEIE